MSRHRSRCGARCQTNTVHAPVGLLPLQNMGEPAALYSWIFLIVAVFGSGSFALDNLRRR